MLTEHGDNMINNPNLQEADQLAIYKCGRGAELGSTKKELQLSGQRGIGFYSLIIIIGCLIILVYSNCTCVCCIIMWI